MSLEESTFLKKKKKRAHNGIRIELSGTVLENN
jgi:hypothetical protein